MWENIAVVNWARGMHPWDKNFFSQDAMQKQREAAGDDAPRDFLDKAKGFLTRHNVAENTIRKTNSFLATLFLAGYFHWTLTKQWTSMGLVPGYTGFRNLAAGLYNYFVAVAEAKINKNLPSGLREQFEARPGASERQAAAYSSQDIAAVKRSRTMMAPASDVNRTTIKTSVRRSIHAIAQFFAGGMEDMLAGTTYHAAIRDGTNRGMEKDRLQYHAARTIGATQSFYHRDARALMLNSQLFRMLQPFQSFVFDAYTTMIWEPTRAGGMTGKDRLWYVTRGAVAVTMMNYLYQALFDKNAFEGFDRDAEPWEFWNAYGSFIPMYGTGRGPGSKGFVPPAASAIYTPLKRGLVDYFETGDPTLLAENATPLFIAGMGLPWAQFFPQVKDTMQVVANDGIAMTRHNVPVRALDDSSAIDYIMTLINAAAFGPERSPYTISQKKRDKELSK
jgi:hypothetical protein